MAACSSIIAWRIPWTEELGGLQSMGSHWFFDDPADVGHLLSGSSAHRISQARILEWVAISSSRGRSEERRVGKECRSRWSPYQ